jgi:hypothetical protein
MKRYFLAIFLVMIYCAPAAAYDEAYFKKLLTQNNELKTLEEYKDSERMIRLKLRQVDNINGYRRQYGVPEVKLDLLSSRVENKQAREAAENDYIGHVNMNGYKPYMRYGLAGGTDHISENAFRTSGYGPDSGSEKDCLANDAQILAAMKDGLDSFMGEGPGGGHHDNVVEESHNYVGLGFHCTDKYNAAYYEGFIDRYIAFDNFKRDLQVEESIVISGRVIPEDTGAYSVIVYYERFPSKMTHSMINARSFYNDYSSETYLSLWPWKIKFNKEDRRFSFEFSGKKKGLYYVKIYIKKGIAGIPYNPRGGASVSTEGLPCASGIVLSVK